MPVSIICNVSFSTSYTLRHLSVSDKRVLIVEYQAGSLSSVYNDGTVRAHLIANALPEVYPFKSCSWYRFPPYGEWKPEIVIMDCGDTIPKEYEGKVEVLRVVWDRKGYVAYLRPYSEVLFL